MRKYAKADIVEVRSSPVQLGRTASLTTFSDFNDYKTSDGYIYVRVKAISSRVNKNHDGWPSEELQKGASTFQGDPIFVDHNNHNHKRTRGVVVDVETYVDDSKNSALDPYYSTAPENHKPPTHIELLLEVDAKTFPKLAKAIVEGDIDSVSMGCDVEYSKCSHCDNIAHSPDEYCAHIRSKGAHFDKKENGRKISKRSYEDCYKISFFEISFVFDPADETALVRDVKTAAILHEGEGIWDAPAEENKPDLIDIPGLGDFNASWSKIARPENAMPQSELPSVPDPVDTLRQTNVCPLCSSPGMEDGKCEVCGYEQPPEGLDNPDLTKAQPIMQKIEDGQDVVPLEQDQGQQDPGGGAGAPGGGAPPMGGGTQNAMGMPMASSVLGTIYEDLTSNITNEKTAATDNSGGRINVQERPLLPVSRKVTDKPKNQKTVSDSLAPVESHTQGEQMNDNTKTAAEPLPDQAADARVEVTEVGGVAGVGVDGDGDVGDSSGRTVNQNVDTVGGTVLNDDAEHVNVDEVVKTDNSGPTKTWTEKQNTPVTPGVSPKQTGIVAGITHEALQILGDPFADVQKVDVGADLKQEIGEETKTFPNPSNRTTDPVTREHFPTDGVSDAPKATHGEAETDAGDLGGPIGENVADQGHAQHHSPTTESLETLTGGGVKSNVDVRTHTFQALRVAKAEVSLGITSAEDELNRADELFEETPSELEARLDTYSRVKTAGLGRTKPEPRVASLPSLQVAPTFAATTEEVDVDDSAIFMR